MVIRPVEGGLNYSCHRVKLVPLLRRGSLQSKAAARPLVACYRRDARKPSRDRVRRSQYDTILMLMNGIGIVGTLERMPEFFKQLDTILASGGQVLCDSSDISYVFETEDGIIELPDDMGYYGEHSFRMQYKDTIGEPFDWLYIDADTLKQKAGRCGYAVELVAEGEHYDYLARITRNEYGYKKTHSSRKEKMQ